MNTTIIKLAAQALLGRRRFWLLLAFPVLLIALTVTVAALTDAEAAWPLLPGLGYPVVLPLVAVLAASSVLGPEVDDGSIVYLLSKPVNRHAVAISKWVVAWAATLVVGSLGVLAAGLVAGGGDGGPGPGRRGKASGDGHGAGPFRVQGCSARSSPRRSASRSSGRGAARRRRAPTAPGSPVQQRLSYAWRGL